MGRKTSAIVATLAALAVAAPSQAANLGTTGGFTYVKKSDKMPASDDFSVGSPEADCPGGTAPVGGGAAIDSDPFSSTIVTTTTNGDDSWSTQLWNYGLFKKSRASAWAICTQKNSKVKNKFSPQSVNAPGPYSLSAQCPNGSTISGGGVAGGPSDVRSWYAHASYMADGADADTEPNDLWVGSIEHRDASQDIWSMGAVCFKSGNPTYKTNIVAMTDPAKAKVMCPNGKSVTGGGFFSPEDDSADASASTSKPIDSNKDNDKIPDDGWQVEMSDPNQPTLQAGVVAACR
jgi:hypothetical protein